MEHAAIFKRRDRLAFLFLPTVPAVLKVFATVREAFSIPVRVLDFTPPLKHWGTRRSWDLSEANVPQNSG